METRRPGVPSRSLANDLLRHLAPHQVVPAYYYYDYVREDEEKIMADELGWIYPGAHYYDDLYQALMTYYFRVKFNMDRRKFNYSALVRSGQMTRKAALENISGVYVIEDPEVIDLCIKRLGLSKEEFETFLTQKPKTFRNYRSNYELIKLFRLPIKALSAAGVLPGTAYAKYFECG